MHLSPPSLLPPVDCPLVIQMPCGQLIRVKRTSHIQSKDGDMDYLTKSGRIITGRFFWTYP